MSNRALNLALRLSADASRLLGGLAKGEGGLRKFGSAARREMDALGQFAGSVEGKLAQLGIGVSAVAAGMQSAKLDKDLKQLQLTAGATAQQADVLRKSLLDAQIATGQGVDELKGGVDALVAGGLSLGEATATVRPMAETLAVSKTNADALAKAMGVAATQFDIDLSKTEEARLLLDKMVVAGRAGNAELENLPDIFARVGSSAKSSNLGLEQTLALVETLSMVEPQADRLATLVDSTLRVFTNANYMKDAAKATGISFFNKDKSRRDAIEVIGDIKKRYDKLTTDRDRFAFISKAFGKADLDTQRGIKTLLDNGALTKLDKVLTNVRDASGTIARELPDAIGNAVDQTGRLQGVLRKAADDFARPINEAISGVIKWGLDSKENGGLGLDGQEILAGGALGALGLFGAARYGGKAIQGLAGKLGGTAAGVATGKALEEAAGVTPVFVVNMPGELGGTVGTPEQLAGAAADVLDGGASKPWWKRGPSLGDVGKMGALGVGGAGVALAGSAMAGWEVGSLISEHLLTADGLLGSEFGARLGERIGEGVAHLLAPFSEEARSAIAADKTAVEAERLATAMREGGALILTNSKAFAKEMQAQAELIGQRIGQDNVKAFLASQPQATGPMARSPILPRSVEDGLRQWQRDKVEANRETPGLNALLTGQAATLERQLKQLNDTRLASTGPLARSALTPEARPAPEAALVKAPAVPLAPAAVIPSNALAAAGQSLGEQVRIAIQGSQPQPAEVTGRIEVQINSEGRPRVTQLQSAGGPELSVYTGTTGAGS